jgi:hypothetical protein
VCGRRIDSIGVIIIVNILCQEKVAIHQTRCSCPVTVDYRIVTGNFDNDLDNVPLS